MKKVVIVLALIIFSLAAYMAYVVVSSPIPVEEPTKSVKIAPSDSPSPEQEAAIKIKTLQGRLDAAEQDKKHLRLDIDSLENKLAAARDEVTKLKKADAEKVQPGVAFRLQGDIFDSGQARLSRNGLDKVREISDQLTLSRSRIRVEGHTDSLPLSAGTAKRHKDNLGLSINRAEAVARALIAFGINPARVSVAGFGSHQPLESNDTAEGRTKNRRVDIIVLD